jgi:hypothetical protein
VGDFILNDDPVSIFDNAKDSDSDGLIGIDVFSKFLIQLDWRHKKLRLSPYPGLTSAPEGVHDADDHLAPGFQRIFFAGRMLIPTVVNDGPSQLFLIDSGSSANLINAATARETRKVHRDSDTTVRGVQGNVKDVSRADRVRLRFSSFSQDNADMIAMDLTRVSDAGVSKSEASSACRCFTI